MRLEQVLRRHWRLLLGVILVAGVIAASVTLLMRRYYLAVATFTPETSSRGTAGGGVAGLAVQLGLSVGAYPTQSPWFYADVLSSRQIMRSVLLGTYCANASAPARAGSCSRRDTLVNLLGLPGHDEASRLEDGQRKLAAALSTDVDRRTDIVTLRVTLPSATLSAQVANRFLEALNDFNLSVRQSSARANLVFVESRLRDQQLRLDSATAALRSFYDANRQFEASPKLRFEELRLKQQLDVQQEVYLTLRREEESARIAQVNDTPVLTVIDSAAVPIRPAGPGRRQIVLAVMIFIGVATAAALYGYENRRDLFQVRHGEPVG